MSEMVERVARAAYLEFAYGNRDLCTEPFPEWFWWIGKDEGLPYDWRKEADRTSVGSDGFLHCAVAAINAMREPTEAMEVAGQVDALPVSTSLIWPAMIDESLR